MHVIILATAMLVSFIYSLVLENTIKLYQKLFSSYHNSKVQLSEMNISTHTWWNLQSCYEVNPKIQHVLLLISLPPI